MLTRLDRQFKTWWVYLWGGVALSLLAALFLIPFYWWFLAAFVGFGTMEGIGIWVSGPNGPYPPLTDVIRAYVPIWVSVPLIWAICAGAGASWWHWHHPLGISLLAGLAGWFTVHFTDAYYKVNKL
jgi:hypothetical protein